MKILVTTDTVGGVWEHTVTLVRRLHAAGCEVLVAAVGTLSEARRAALPPGVQVTARAYKLEWMQDATDDVRAAARWLRELAQLWNADVAHLNQMAYAAFGFPCPVVTAVHSDVLSWWTHIHGREAPPEWATYAGWVRDGLRASDAIVTPTHVQAALLQRHYGLAATRVIHNGVEPPARDPDAGLDPLVLCVGRAWDEGKGVDILDAAVGMIPGPDVPPVYVLGETVAPHGSVFEARNVGSLGRVEPVGVEEWMRFATIYVAPSRYEPFGLAPLEAALNGCALVLSDLGTFRELWDGCAEFFPVGDAGALAGILRRLLADPERVARLAEGARTRALRRYSAERMARDYAALYRDLSARPQHLTRSVA